MSTPLKYEALTSYNRLLVPNPLPSQPARTFSFQAECSTDTDYRFKATERAERADDFIEGTLTLLHSSGKHNQRTLKGNFTFRTQSESLFEGELKGVYVEPKKAWILTIARTQYLEHWILCKSPTS